MCARLSRLPVAVALLGGCAAAPAVQEVPIPVFEKVELSGEFHAEGSALGDLNRDGATDIVAGPYWYEGPDFDTRHEYYGARAFDPEEYSDNFFAHTQDFNNDGWADILILGFPGEDVRWYENPGESQVAWLRHDVFDGLGSESPAWVDLTGDGRPEVVGIFDGSLGYVVPDWDEPHRPWTFHPISPGGSLGTFTHGLGIGDVDGDGRNDVLVADGWWEQPQADADDPVWAKHDFAFGPGGAQMFAYDLDGDGLNDIVTSLDAHGYGMAWFKQVNRDGRRTFERNLIMNESTAEPPYGVSFSQLHAVQLTDLDGDGIKDVVTGKRYWAHGSTGDPEPDAPAVIYWFKTVREDDGAGVRFVPFLIDDDSGVGVDVVVGDANGDGLLDIVTSNKKGTFVMIQTTARDE